MTIDWSDVAAATQTAYDQCVRRAPLAPITGQAFDSAGWFVVFLWTASCR